MLHGVQMLSFSERLLDTQNELLVLEFAAGECFSRFHDWRRSDLLRHARAAIASSRPSTLPPTPLASPALASPATTPQRPLSSSAAAAAALTLPTTPRWSFPAATPSASPQERLFSPMGELQARDVRKLDPGLSPFETLPGGGSSEAALLVRDGAIIISMAMVRGLILHDRCYIVVPPGEAYTTFIKLDSTCTSPLRCLTIVSVYPTLLAQELIRSSTFS